MAYADLRGMVLDEKLVEYALADLMPESKEIKPEQDCIEESHQPHQLILIDEIRVFQTSKYN